MNLIRELIFIVSKQPPKDLDLLLPPESKVRIFFDAVQSQMVQNDDEAALFIYQSSKSDKKYLMLKRNLIKKLNNLVLEAEHSELDKNNYVNIRFANEKLLTIAEKLLLENVYHNAEKLIKKVLKQAEKFQLIALELDAYKKLRTIYYLKGFPVETFLYHQKIQELTQTTQRLEYVIGAWQLIESKRKFALAKSAGLVDDIDDFFAPTEIYISENDNIFTQLYYLRIQKIKAYNAYDMLTYRTILDKLRQIVTEYPFLRTNSLMIDLYVSEMKFFSTTCDFEQAEINIKKAIGFSDFSAFNRYDVLAKYFDLLLKNKKLRGAAKIITEVFSTPGFDMLDDRDRSAWYLREVYLYFFLQASGNSTAVKYKNGANNDLNLNDFYQNTKFVSKDKKGYNLVAFIFRFLFLILKGETDMVSDGNNLKTYFHRYLRGITEERTRIFVKSLYKLAVAEISAEQILDKKRYFVQSVARSKLGNFLDDCEWIRYETIFDLLYESFQKK